MADLDGIGATARAVADLPKELAVIRRFLSHIGTVEIVTAMAGLAITVVLSASQAFLRYTFGTSLWWAGEIIQYAVFASYFLGISYVFKTRQYILIEFVSTQFPLKLQLVFYCVAQVLAAVFAAGTVWLLYLFLPTLLNMQSPVLGLPAWILPIPLTLGSAMIVVTSLYYLAFGLWALAQGVAGDTLHEIESVALIAEPLKDAEEW
jgi:C4-dicarboxylate transporter, DctQ subunit